MSDNLNLPWSVFVTDGGAVKVSSTGGGSVCQVDRRDEANAEFIVRAANCHADLLEACKAALSDLQTFATASGLANFGLASVEQLQAAITKATT